MNIQAPKKINQSQRSLLKEQKKREITALLKGRGPLEPLTIANSIADLSLVAANRYLDELLIAGHVRKALSPGKRKNIRAFEYQNAYGTKMDIVSVALSHPLHQLTLFTAGKAQDQHESC